jgi:hypothetical protein
VAIQNLFTSRDNKLDGNTYVGQFGRLWYNPDTNSLYASDGVTVGGIPVDLATGANITANIVTLNTVTSTSGTVTVTGNLAITGNISPAAEGKIGGITPGPGVFVGNTGILTIDSANLPVSFGNFTANNNVLEIVNVDENMILRTQGSAEIQLVGNVGFYKPNGIPPDTVNLFFFANNDGQITILTPATDAANGAVEIRGSATGNALPAQTTGAMIHITGNNDTYSAVLLDAIGNVPFFVSRRFNGNTTSPTQVLDGQQTLVVGSTPYTSSAFPSFPTAFLSWVASGDQTGTNYGANIEVYATAANSTSSSLAAKFTASALETVSLSATGNITGGNLLLTSGGIISSTGLISTTGNITAANVNAFVNLSAGTANIAPLRFTAGNLLATPQPGAMSYDGTVFYATPQDDERGLIVTEQIYVINADYNLVDQTAVQTLLGAATNLSSNTRYAYRIIATVYKTADNIALQYALGGTATLARHTYDTVTTASAALGTVVTPSALRNILTTGFGTAVTVSAGLNGAGYYSLAVSGKINVTTGGTWFPQIGFTGLPGAGSLVTGGSSIEIWPIGAAGANVSIGAWS